MTRNFLLIGAVALSACAGQLSSSLHSQADHAAAAPLVMCQLESMHFWNGEKATYVGYLRPSATHDSDKEAVLALPESRINGYQATIYGYTLSNGALGLVLGIGLPGAQPIAQKVIDDFADLPADLTYSVMEGSSRRYLSLTCSLAQAMQTEANATPAMGISPLSENLECASIGEHPTRLHIGSADLEYSLTLNAGPQQSQGHARYEDDAANPFSFPESLSYGTFRLVDASGRHFATFYLNRYLDDLSGELQLQTGTGFALQHLDCSPR